MKSYSFANLFEIYVSLKHKRPTSLYNDSEAIHKNLNFIKNSEAIHLLAKHSLSH